MMVSVSRRLIALFMSLMMLAASVPASAEQLLDDQINERPSGMAMLGDAVVARPMGLVLTVGGLGVFLVTLPFSALGGNVGEAAKTLVANPAKATFTRCLGCTGTQDEWKNSKVADGSSQGQ
ncbi:MAG TPA: hypothetical protein VF050_07555 [Moraxellaceae bacterium]